MNIKLWNIRYFRAARYQNSDRLFDDYSCLPRPFTTIGYITKGSWSYTQNFKNSDKSAVGEVHEGELIYLPQGATYSAVWKGGASGIAECISLHFELEGHILDSMRTSIQPVAVKDSGICGIFERILEIYTIDKDGAADSPEHTALQSELISKLFQVISSASRQLEIKNSADMDPRIEPALEYIHSHMTEKISAAGLAARCCLSEPYFYILFRKSMGMHFIEYWNSILVSNAELMLMDFPELSIEEVSTRLGFSSSAYFRKVFKRFLGCSPSEYRKKHRHPI